MRRIQDEAGTSVLTLDRAAPARRRPLAPSRPRPKRTMSAAVVTGPGACETRKVPLPEPPAGSVRVALEGCGVCGSHLPLWEGRPWFQYPLEPGAPGHEGWGHVDAVGPGVKQLNVGDRVALLSYHAFAEFDVAEAAHVVPLPPELDGKPFPGEALGCAMNVFARSNILPGQTVAVVGVGFLGALLTRLAAQAGARVITLSRRPFAAEIAHQLGAQETFVLEDPTRAVDEVMHFTGGLGCPRVIEATGLPVPLDVAANITAERGRLVIAGYHQDGPRQVNLQLWNWRGLDVINAHERDPRQYIKGMRAAVEWIANGRFDATPLYTHAFPPDQIAHAFDALRERPTNFLKALVTYD